MLREAVSTASFFIFMPLAPLPRLEQLSASYGWQSIQTRKEVNKMKLSRILMMTAAATILSTAAMAEGMTGSSANNVNNEPTTSVNDTSRPQTDANANMGAGTSADVSANARVAANVDSSTIQQVQESLKSEGHSVTADGVWGPQTASALRQFQENNGLTPTGSIDSQTLAALDINAGM